MSKLFLASENFGRHKQILLDWLPKSPKVAMILNAADVRGVEGRESRKQYEIAMLSEAGLGNIEEVDLRKFHDATSLKLHLSRYDLVWVRGGNTFYLRWLYKESGFEKAIKELIDENKIIYAGYSAGACVMSSGLWGLEYWDKTQVAPERVLEGLGYLDFVIIPHADAARYAKKVKFIKNHLESKNIPFIALGDQQVIVVEDGKWRLLA